MIVTLSGAYRNAGDYLIRDCAHNLLRRFVDPEIVDVDRKAISRDHYALFNRATAVFLCGGPAYQKNIYPSVYPIDLNRITAPVIPFGLGWKARLSEDIETFRFSEAGLGFVKRIHTGVRYSSVRDDLTMQLLTRNGVQNVLMTGCPAWYDLDALTRDYEHKCEVRRAVFSAPAIVDKNCLAAIKLFSTTFSRSEKFISFHHGLLPATSVRGAARGLTYGALAAYARSLGLRTVNLQADLQGMRDLYDSADLHIGYRVHAHFYCLSRRRASILISEDTRALGQGNFA